MNDDDIGIGQTSREIIEAVRHMPKNGSQLDNNAQVTLEGHVQPIGLREIADLY